MTVKLRLTLDVEYEPNGESVVDLMWRLFALADFASAEGLLYVEKAA